MLYIMLHATDTTRQISTVSILLDKLANTEDPYKNILRTGEFPTIDATPKTNIPVPRKNEEAIDIANFLRKIMLRKTYKLAQPRLIISFPRIAHIREPTPTANEVPTNSPAKIVANKYEMHMQAIANAQTIVLDII